MLTCTLQAKHSTLRHIPQTLLILSKMMEDPSYGIEFQQSFHLKQSFFRFNGTRFIQTSLANNLSQQNSIETQLLVLSFEQTNRLRRYSLLLNAKLIFRF